MTYVLMRWTRNDADQTELEVDIEVDRYRNADITGIRVMGPDDGLWHDISADEFETIKNELIANDYFWDVFFYEKLPDDLRSLHYRDACREYA